MKKQYIISENQLKYLVDQISHDDNVAIYEFKTKNRWKKDFIEREYFNKILEIKGIDDDTKIIRFFNGIEVYEFEKKDVKFNDNQTNAYVTGKVFDSKYPDIDSSNEIEKEFEKQEIDFNKLRDRLARLIKKDTYSFNKSPFKQIWKEYAKPPGEAQQNNLRKGLEILKEAGKIDDVDYFYSKIIGKHGFILDDNGNWSPINKLTGNYTQFREIILNLFKKYKNSPDIIQMYHEIVNGNKNIYDILNKDTFIDILKKDIGDDISKWSEDNSKVTVRHSGMGSEVEKRFKNILISKNIPILYEGGDGDLIDIEFSIDFIIDLDGKIVTVQCKNNKTNGQIFYEKSKLYAGSDRYKFVDKLTYPDDITGKFKWVTINN